MESSVSDMARAYCDCHVNIWNDEHVLAALLRQQLGRVRCGADGAQGRRRHAAIEEMADVDKAIVFALRYGDSRSASRATTNHRGGGGEISGQVRGLRLLSTRAGADYMDLLVHAVEDLKLKGVKFGPIYNGVALVRSAARAGLRVSAEAQSPADHAYGHDLCPQRAGRYGPRPFTSSRWR